MSLFDTSSGEEPRPQLRLRRAVLWGVGPSGARFDPLKLDLTGADGTAADRALLSLTNTGGKSTLITLLSSVIVPGARQQVGRKNLGDYLLTGDTGHVVCEWDDTSRSTRTVTGVVMEWRNGKVQPPEQQRSAAVNQMHRTWYLFQTSEDLPGIGDLPFLTEDGRRSSHEQFTASLNQLYSDHPAMRGTATARQIEWAQELDARTSLDPVLFSYQMRMNDSEAGAEALLADFGTPEAVVRFFVGALNDAQATTLFTENVGKYAAIAGQRPELEVLTGFCSQVRPAIGVVAERGDEERAARLSVDLAATAGDELAAALGARVAADAASLAELEQAAEVARVELGRLRTLSGTIPDIRAQLRLEAARDRLAGAETALITAAERERHARAEAAAWAAVDDLVTAEAALATLEGARKALAEADKGLDPLRGDVDLTAGHLGARLDTLITDAADAERQAWKDHDAAKRLRQDAVARALTAQRAISAVEGDLEADAQAISEAERSVRDAEAHRILRPGEDVGDGRRRWAEALDAAQESRKVARSEADEADRAYDADDKPLRTATANELAANAEVRLAHERTATFATDLAGVAEDDAVTALLDSEVTGPADLRRVVQLASGAAAEADLRASSHHQKAQEADVELAHLTENGTARTSDDVLAVTQILNDGRIGATTGLEWIERNVADADTREQFIAARPDVAGGVVVTDKSRFAEAVEALTGARRPTLRSPVVVTTSPTEIAGTEEDDRHVVIPHRATWDRTWAEETRSNLESDLERHRDATSAARAAADAHRHASAISSAFLAQWAEVDAETLDAAATVAEADAAEAEAAREAIEERRRRNKALARKRRDDAEDALGAERRAAKALRVVESAVAAVAAAGTARQRKAALESDLRSARADAQTAADDQERASRAADDAATDREANRARKVDLEAQRAALGHPSAEADPGGNLDTVRRAYRDAQRRLEDASAGLPEAQLVSSAERSHGDAAARLTVHSGEALRRASELASTIDASTSDARRQEAERAGRAATEEQRAMLRAEVERDTARTEVREIAPRSARPNHADLRSTPEWLPSSPADIPELLGRLDAHAETLRHQTAAAERESEEGAELLKEVAEDVRAIGDSADMWRDQGTAVGAVAAFTGPKEDGRVQMKRALTTFTDATAKAGEASARLSEAVARVRAVANDVQWAQTPGVLPIRIRRLSDGELVAEARTLAGQVAALEASAAGDLAALDTNRTILRDTLIQLCSEQRTLLRDVAAQSRLPDGLGGLTGQLSLKITFETAAADEAAGRLAHRIDTWAQEIAAHPKRATSSEARVRWLAAAVGDTVVDRPRAGKFSIEVLKPTLDGRPQYCAPDRIPSEFSGGQLLTLAVLVYCALSKVRSTRRTGGARPAGTLILDNPFGAASAEALIAMQHRLATRTGVQLVCATGLHDPGVDAAFSRPGSVIAKLHNDGDLRRNLRHLRLMATLVDGVDIAGSLSGDRPIDDARSWVRSTTYEVQA